jgi:hypothetical protein
LTKEPFVLLVDDDPTQEAFALLLSQQGVEAKHVLPDEITPDDLNRANLVLIDEFIEAWPGRAEVKDNVGLYVRDGIALAGVLRSTLEGRGPSSENRPVPTNTALVLRTGHLDVLAAGTPEFVRPMAIASRHDLEWVTEKGKISAQNFVSLATAAATLPNDWSNPADPTAQIEWLGLEQETWREEALAQIEMCRPPWSVLAATSAGRRWLSWFLQRILPFPTFLVDDLRAASYLGLKPSALDAIVGGGSTLADPLKRAVYSGQLSNFAGRRWWRAGIASVKKIAVEASVGRTADDVARAIVVIHGSELETIGLRQPVFQIDANYRIVTEALEISSAVRLQPDDWPSYADYPWYDFGLKGNNPDLDALIVIDDRADTASAEVE